MKKTFIFLLLLSMIAIGCSFQDISINGTVYEDIDGNGSYDENNDKGLEGVEIKSGNKTITSSAKGSFILDGEVAGAGTIKLQLKKDGYDEKKYSVNIIQEEESSALGPEYEEIFISMETN